VSYQGGSEMTEMSGSNIYKLGAATRLNDGMDKRLWRTNIPATVHKLAEYKPAIL